MIEGPAFWELQPNGFGIQLYSGGAVSMSGTVIANVTTNTTAPRARFRTATPPT